MLSSANIYTRDFTVNEWILFNPLEMKSKPLYLKMRFVQRSEHSPPRIYKPISLCFADLACRYNSVNNQPDAQFFFLIFLFQFSTCFEQHSAHHQENRLYKYNFWCMSHCVGDRLVSRSGSSFPTCILDGHLHSVTYTRSCIYTIDSPDDEHCAARNM